MLRCETCGNLRFYFLAGEVLYWMPVKNETTIWHYFCHLTGSLGNIIFVIFYAIYSAFTLLLLWNGRWVKCVLIHISFDRWSCPGGRRRTNFSVQQPETTAERRQRIRQISTHEKNWFAHDTTSCVYVIQSDTGTRCAPLVITLCQRRPGLLLHLKKSLNCSCCLRRFLRYASSMKGCRCCHEM